MVVGVLGFDLHGEPYRDVASGFQFTLEGGVRVTVTAGASLRLQDLTRYSGDPSVPGVGLIDYHWNGGENSKGTLLSFGRPLTFFALEAGDWGSDDDGPLELTAYDCAGRELSKSTAPWGAEKNPPFAILSVTGQGICSVRYRSGGQYPGSTFVRNLRGE